MDDTDIKIVSENEDITITYDRVKDEFKFDRNSTICLFIMQAINLKTDINISEERFKCKAEGTEFDVKNIKQGTIEPHAFMMIASIKLFIDWYTSHYDDTIATHVEKRLYEKRDDLFFSGIKVDTEGQDFVKLREIIDALCVRFYQELILAITEGFAMKHQAFKVTADMERNGYNFAFRNYNIIELDMIKKMGQLPINIQS